MSGARDRVEGLPWFRAARAVSVGVDLDAMDGIDTAALVDRARCYVTEDPPNASYEYDQDDATAANGFSVVAPGSNVGRWKLQSIGGAGAFITQATWYIDSAAGDDRNDGLTLATALLTPGELTRRWAGRAFDPAVTTVNVYLYGTFPLAALVINATVTVLTTINIMGRTTQVGAGVVTAFQVWDSAADLRGQLTDGAQNFTAHVRRRLRLTSGAGAGAMTWIGSLGGGVTVANVGQFRTPDFPTGVDKAPAPGDAYVVETVDTTLLEYHYLCDGPALVNLYDVDVATRAAFPAAGGFARCKSLAPSSVYMRVIGCRLGCVAGSDFGLFGQQQLLACSLYGPPASTQLGPYFYTGFYNLKGLCAFTSMHCYYGAQLTAYATLHDGNGTDWVGLQIQEGSRYRALTNTFDAYFGSAAGTDPNTLVRVSNMSQYILSTSYFWGTGNATATALQVTNGNGAYYTPAQKPKATGAVPGNDVVLADGVPIAWAAIPAVAAPPGNAAVLEKT